MGPDDSMSDAQLRSRSGVDSPKVNCFPGSSGKGCMRKGFVQAFRHRNDLPIILERSLDL
jgi:hypothetical protein